MEKEFKYIYSNTLKMNVIKEFTYDGEIYKWNDSYYGYENIKNNEDWYTTVPIDATPV